MIRCLAIDDEPLALRQLEAYLRKVPCFEVAGCLQSALEAVTMLSEEAVDVVFIDINMPDLNGLDFVRSLQRPPMVVFTTAYQEYALEGYKVDAVDYLLKPFGMADVLAAADKVKRRYDLLHAQAAPAAEGDDAMFLKTEHRVVRVLPSDIIYVEGMAEYLRIHLAGRCKPLTVLLSMKKMEERLGDADFMRVHRSYIISLRHLSEVSRGRVTLDNGEEIPVGESSRERLHDYVSGKLLGK